MEMKTVDGRPYTVHGIVISWRVSGKLTLVKIRQPEGIRPKYAEVFRDRSRFCGIYPDPNVIHPGLPLVVTEGEFDAVCLGQELGNLASVVTLGSASARPEPDIFRRMLAAAPWFIAMDQDEAGLKAAEAWPLSARRIRPPGSFKDWTEAKAGRVDLRRWWSDILAGNPNPPLFTWDELAAWRWGPALNDPASDIKSPFTSRG